MPETARGAEADAQAEPDPIPDPELSPPTPDPRTARRRTALLAAGALVVVAAVGAGVVAARGSGSGGKAAAAADGLPHTTVEVATSGCGSGRSETGGHGEHGEYGVGYRRSGPGRGGYHGSTPRRRAARVRARPVRRRRSRLMSNGSAARASGLSINALRTW